MVKCGLLSVASCKGKELGQISDFGKAKVTNRLRLLKRSPKFSECLAYAIVFACKSSSPSSPGKLPFFQKVSVNITLLPEAFLDLCSWG